VPGRRIPQLVGFGARVETRSRLKVCALGRGLAARYTSPADCSRPFPRMQGSVAIIEPDLTPAVGSEPVQVIAGEHATNRARRNSWYVVFGDRRPCGLRVVGRRGGDSTRRGANMNIGLTYKVSIEAVMMITEFLGGWSSDGITAGVVTSVEPGT
jgi:hypothetical protein